MVALELIRLPWLNLLCFLFAIEAVNCSYCHNFELVIFFPWNILRSTLKSLNVAHWTYAPLHRNWKHVTNLTWLLLYPDVILVVLAVLSTDKQFGTACRETQSWDTQASSQAGCQPDIQWYEGRPLKCCLIWEFFSSLSCRHSEKTC